MHLRYMLPPCSSTTGLTFLQRGGGERCEYPSPLPAVVFVTLVLARFSSIERKRGVAPVLFVAAQYISVAHQEICSQQVLKYLHPGARRPQEAILHGYACLRPRARHSVDTNTSIIMPFESLVIGAKRDQRI